MKIYIPCYTGSKYEAVTLESLECNVYLHHDGDYTIFAYNNSKAYNGNNIYNDIQGVYDYINKDYGKANKHKIDVNTIEWKYKWKYEMR